MNNVDRKAALERIDLPNGWSFNFDGKDGANDFWSLNDPQGEHVHLFYGDVAKTFAAAMRNDQAEQIIEELIRALELAMNNGEFAVSGGIDEIQTVIDKARQYQNKEKI